MVLLNVVLSALSLYYMSFFILLRWVKNIIDHIRKRFCGMKPRNLVIDTT